MLKLARIIARVVCCAVLMYSLGAFAQDGAAKVHDPLSMEFRRLAVQRFVFNNNLPLCTLDPTTVVALDLMHPYACDGATGDAACSYAIDDGTLVVSNNADEAARSAMLVGGMNPFAVYDIDIASLKGSGQVAVDLGKADHSERLTIALEFKEKGSSRIVARFIRDGKVELEERLRLEKVPQAPCTLRVQMLGTGVAVYLVKGDTCRLQGTVETNTVTDFRKKTVFMATKFRIATQLAPGAEVHIRSAKSYLSCGVGQADIRMVTYKDGTPYWKDDRLWFLFSARGWLLPHSIQGVFSLDPTLFDPKLEGVIVFDMGDGLLRNDIGTHLFYDAEADEWRGWSCNFSTIADGNNRYPSGINFVSSKREPLRGFSVMQARAAESLTYKHEDPCGIWDAEAGKWRLLLSSFHETIQASLWESDQWDGPFTKVAGPVAFDSTGTVIQKIGDTRYIFAGSADRAVYIYSYPALESLGKLKMDFEPWNDTVTNGRVWPNIFPAPEGHPYPYLAFMMDRANFPKLKGWNYGALYLYGAVPPME